MKITDEIYNYTARKIEYLHSIEDTGVGRGLMANLRRGVGKLPGELPELWGIIFDRIPQELLGTGEASYSEWAIYTALTLYAMHQQGSEQFMHKKDISLGTAAAQLAKSPEDEPRIINRMNLVVTANSPNDLAYHLRSIIQLMRAEGLAIDYARLAVELYQMNYEESANAVKLKWGRDFYKYRFRTEEREIKNG